MKTLMKMLLASATMAVVYPALAADSSYKSETKVERAEDGSYEKEVSAERKDAAGRVATETKTELDVDSDGDSTKTTTTTDVKDPKGLMNKKVIETEKTVKVRDGNVSTEIKKDVD